MLELDMTKGEKMTQDQVAFCDECYADLIEGYEHNCNPNQEVLKTVGQE